MELLTPGQGALAILRLLLPLLAVALLAGACNGGNEAVPATLMDGSSALDVPVELEGVPLPTVLTKVRIARVAGDEPGAASTSCLRERNWSVQAAGAAVERVGVSSESVTLRDASGVAVLGCDNSLGRREENRRWCGGAYGKLFRGRLHDARLDIICTAADGKHLGFMWVEPVDGSRYVAVEQLGYAEVYEVAAGLPVRVATTSGVDVEGARAGLDASEHDARGRLLRRYRLEAVVAD